MILLNSPIFNRKYTYVILFTYIKKTYQKVVLVNFLEKRTDFAITRRHSVRTRVHHVFMTKKIAYQIYY